MLFHKHIKVVFFIYFASSVRAMTADTYGAAEDVPLKVNVHSLLRANVA